MSWRDRRTAPIVMLTQNIQAMPRMRAWKVKEDVWDVARLADLVGWQEIKWHYYREILGKLEDEGGWETYWGRGRANEGLDEYYDHEFKENFATPISWRVDVFEFIRGGSWRLHPKTPGVCGERWVTWVLLREKKKNAKVLVYNFHMVAGAWNPFVKRKKELRQEMWRNAWTRIQKDIRRKRKSYPNAAVVGMADFNANMYRDKKQMRRKIKGLPWMQITHPKGVDHLFLMRGKKYFWSKTKTRLENQHSDHAGKYVISRLRW